jgi:hypothetical protein
MFLFELVVRTSISVFTSRVHVLLGGAPVREEAGTWGNIIVMY